MTTKTTIAADPATETVDAIPPPEPLKANRRSLMGRLFGRKNKKQTEGEDVIEHRGKAGKSARASKKVVKKKQEAPVGEDREPEAAKNETPKAVEEKVEPKTEEKTDAPTDAVADPPADKVVPETVSESGTEEENTLDSTPAEKEADEDKGDEPAEQENEEEAQDTPATEEPKTEEEPAEAQVQSGDDSSRDPPTAASKVALFCGCI